MIASVPRFVDSDDAHAMAARVWHRLKEEVSDATKLIELGHMVASLRCKPVETPLTISHISKVLRQADSVLRSLEDIPRVYLFVRPDLAKAVRVASEARRTLTNERGLLKANLQLSPHVRAFLNWERKGGATPRAQIVMAAAADLGLSHWDVARLESAIIVGEGPFEKLPDEARAVEHGLFLAEDNKKRFGDDFSSPNLPDKWLMAADRLERPRGTP